MSAAESLAAILKYQLYLTKGANWACRLRPVCEPAGCDCGVPRALQSPPLLVVYRSAGSNPVCRWACGTSRLGLKRSMIQGSIPWLKSMADTAQVIGGKAVKVVTDAERMESLVDTLVEKTTGTIRSLRGYIRVVHAWLKTTKVPTQQRGVQLLAQTSGELRSLLSTLDPDLITEKDGGEHVVDLVRKQFEWILVRSLPHLFEETVYNQAGQRLKTESFVTYNTARMTWLFQKLEKEG
eukprot:2619058-Amphidinium_carterae.3